MTTNGVELRGVSRWYGNVVAVNDVTMDLGPGVTGLLGPNGAGKTTLLNMMAGFLPPSRGEVLVQGQPSWRNPSVYSGLGLVSEREAVHGFLSGWEFVLASAKLHRLRDPDGAARRAAARIPLGRYGEPAEFGRVAAFVLSPAASYMTGSMVTVDGGMVPTW